jgi:hypothetical protein
MGSRKIKPASSDAEYRRLLQLREDRREEVDFADGEEGPAPAWIEMMRAEARRREARRRNRFALALANAQSIIRQDKQSRCNPLMYAAFGGLHVNPLSSLKNIL